MNFSRHRPVRRDDVDVQLVDVVELGRLGVGRSGHARKFVIEPEIILDRDRGQGLGFAVDLDPFLGLDRLVQTIAPTAARHFTAGEFIDDDDLVFLDHVSDVFFKEAIGAQELRDVVDPLGLHVAMVLAVSLGLVLFFLGQVGVEIDLGELVDQIREDE